ncbi:non-canonical purine NTP pyrophosphatase [Gemmatimonas groenlandica]|uniref:dITP/XTP pyrophosphatase n=1 Tax=Gemmatimonas groenlandica TaxID=2732249 RepID=A0A6M4IYZ7_9BACT|nr:non-canonical purine NTP pyrophosphatase [Gemmatimonas groenlandica]
MGDGVLDTRLVLATRSAGKLKELVPLMAVVDLTVITLADLGLPESPDEDALEVFDTFEANALAKARYFAQLTGAIVLADDSGLAVDALGGRPGVYSKRWSGRTDLAGVALDAANNAFLQEALRVAQAETVGDTSPSAPSSRRARYVCAAACVWRDGTHWREAVVRGETSGTLLAAPRGTGGFGYDPYFLSDDLGATFAEVARDAKARVSHRGRAFTALLQVDAVRAHFVHVSRLVSEDGRR